MLTYTVCTSTYAVTLTDEPRLNLMQATNPNEETGGTYKQEQKGTKKLCPNLTMSKN